jgi:hypothetical protein
VRVVHDDRRSLFGEGEIAFPTPEDVTVTTATSFSSCVFCLPAFPKPPL